MSMTSEKLEIIRTRLVNSQFQANAFVKNALVDIQLASTEPSLCEEQRLLNLFDSMTKELSDFSSFMEGDISTLQQAVDKADEVLLKDLDHHEMRLEGVRRAMDDVNKKFGDAMNGAVRLGSRLASVEKERGRIESAIETMTLIKAFESIPITEYAELVGMDGKLIKAALPEPMRVKGKTWGDYALALYELRRILVDINAVDVQNAQANVLRVSEAVEREMLSLFERSVTKLMSDLSDIKLLKKCRDLALWLHYFNDGQALHKRYIYSVVERRLPRVILKGEQVANRYYQRQMREKQRKQNESTWRKLKRIGDEVIPLACCQLLLSLPSLLSAIISPARCT